MDAFYLSNKYVSPTSYDVWVKVRDRLEWICDNWQLPDAGIWEMRNRQEHFVYSKVMNWVALIVASGWPISVRFQPIAQSGSARRPHLRRSNDQGMERETPRIYPVLRQ